MNSKQYLTSLTIIHLGLLMGQVIFGVIAFFLNSQEDFSTEGDNSDLRNIFIYLVPFLILSGVSAGFFMMRSRLSMIQQKNSLAEKLQEYRTVLIMKYALMEGPALVALVAYLLTADLMFLGLAALVIVFFVLERPSKDKIIMDLALNSEGRSALQNPETKVL
ncbi:MAG: hypothetical protein NW226_06450 [Microscillaceae bacterium]|nr:hypothetical protein [Microscillaceae bacterium]